MRNRILSLAALMAMTAFSSVNSYAQQAEQFFQLRKDLGYKSLLFHAGKLWAGSERFQVDNPAGGHELLVFDGKTLGEPVRVKLTHAPQFVQAYGPNQIIAIGLSAYGNPTKWQSHFSIISFDASTYNVDTTDLPDYGSFPEAIYVRRYAAVGPREFFSLQYGENAVMEWDKQGDHKLLPFHIVKPDIMLDVKGSLFVLEKDNTDNVFKIDLRSMTSKKLFPNQTHRDVISDLKYWTYANLVAAAEEKGLILIDPERNQIVSRIDFAGEAGGLTEMGQCLLVTAVNTKLVYVIAKGSNGTVSTINTFDLSKLGSTFSAVRAVTYDAENKQIFARSAESCAECAGSPNGLAKIWDIPQATKDACGI